jgi:hypothetical protein
MGNTQGKNDSEEDLSVNDLTRNWNAGSKFGGREKGEGRREEGRREEGRREEKETSEQRDKTSETHLVVIRRGPENQLPISAQG